MANANIFLQAPRVKSVDDWRADADAKALRSEQLKGAQRQNALADLVAQQQTQTMTETAADRNALAQIAAGWSGQTSPDQRIMALRNSGRPGLMQQADALEKQWLERRKTEAEAGKVDAETLAKHLDSMKFLSQSVMSAPTPQNAALAIDAFERLTGRQMPEERQRLAQLQTPEQVRQWAAGHALKADELLPKLQMFNTGKQQVPVDMNALTNPAQQPLQMTTTPGEDLTAQTSRANNAATVGATIRGQNLADARARDANATQRELLTQERELKVGELKEKAADRARAKDASISSIGNQVAVIDKALSHPGRTTATGLSGSIDPRNYVPGTDATDFRAVLDQIGGAAFLQAFENLKGGGAITEVEGKKATDAIARLNRAQSDKEFETSLRELRQVMTTGYKRLSGKDYQGGATPGAFSDVEKERRYQEWKRKQGQ